MKLMTLAEMVQTHPMTELCSGTQIDEATQAEIFDWFQFRQVCDNDRFPVYFNRLIRSLDHQYTEYLRVDMTTFDPMVVDYMERQITRTAEYKSNETRNNKSTEGIERSSETTNSGSDVTDYTGNQTATGKSDTTGSNDATINGTTGTTSESTTTGETSGLIGDTPDSSLYPAVGYPAGLRWEFASNQSEGKSKGTTGGTENVTVSQTENTSSEDHTTSSNETKDTSQSTLTHGLKTNGSGTETRTNSGEDTSINTRNDDSDIRERHSGRREAPQDLLNRARNYILKTNAFRWLIDRLDVAFFAIYEMEEC